jgi:hypothetical protein
MPFLKYFGFVGGSLLVLLLALNWLLPDTKTEQASADAAKPVIRISSLEQLPEKVDFDTNAPAIPPSAAKVESKSQLPQSAFVFAQITPGSLPSFALPSNVTRMADAAVTSQAVKQNGRRRSQVPVAAIRLSLIDDMRSRFGKDVFRLN